MKPFLSWLALLLALSACSTLNAPFGSLAGYSKPETPEQADAILAAAEKEFAAGRTEDALDLVVIAREATGLPTETRVQIETAVERYAERRIQELSVPGSEPEDLADLVQLNLPRQLAVRAGVTSAALMLQQNEPYAAYAQIKEIDKKFPNHYERVRAGEILYDAGMELADDDWSFLGMFAARDDGIEILEYLWVNYPKVQNCDRVFAKLALLYEEDEDWRLARERCEDLLLYHSTSPLAPWAEARIPHVRLAGLASPEYDRKELVRARRELETWIQRYANQPTDPPDLERDVRLDYADCLARLVTSDLGIARFYQRVDEPVGARFHAERALEEARTCGDEELVRQATATLAGILPPTTGAEATPETPPVTGTGGPHP